MMKGHEWHLKEIFDKSPIGITFLDREGNLTDANPSALKIMGYPSLNEVIGINIFNAVDMGSKKDELLENGYIKIQAPVDFDKSKKKKMISILQGQELFLLI